MGITEKTSWRASLELELAREINIIGCCALLYRRPWVHGDNLRGFFVSHTGGSSLIPALLRRVFEDNPPSSNAILHISKSSSHLLKEHPDRFLLPQQNDTNWIGTRVLIRHLILNLVSRPKTATFYQNQVFLIPLAEASTVAHTFVVRAKNELQRCLRSLGSSHEIVLLRDALRHHGQPS